MTNVFVELAGVKAVNTGALAPVTEIVTFTARLPVLMHTTTISPPGFRKATAF